MATDHNKRAQIKLTPKNEKTLAKIQRDLPVKVTLTSLANRAIEVGASNLFETHTVQPQSK